MQTASYMQKLLQIEWLKLKNYRAFIIIASFFALGVFTANYIVFRFVAYTTKYRMQVRG